MKLTQRMFAPGSKWVYIKLYVGARMSDTILIEDIVFVVRQLKKAFLIEKWFFIRYSDPEFHIRIRLLVKDESFVGEVIQSFYKRLHYSLENEIVWRMQLDTYNRELERYGNALIEETETFFYHDSECLINILSKLNKLDNENYRWMISLALIDQLLVDFSLDLIAKQRLMEIMSNSFKAEFGFDDHNSRQLNLKFRNNKKLISDSIEKNILDNGFAKLYSPINKRSKNLKPIINEIINGDNSQKNSVDNILISYIHMMLNRLFRTKNRIHELVIYDFMKRYYKSKIAQDKYIPRNNI
jgi:thiopeptide-type bacteriocin biosynthesis protein